MDYYNRNQKQKQEAAKRAGQAVLKNVARKGLAMLWKALLPYLIAILPTILIVLGAALVVGAVYFQFTGYSTSTFADDEYPFKEESIIATDEANIMETYLEGENIHAMVDTYGRDRQLAMTWGQTYAVLTFLNSGKDSDVLSNDAVTKKYIKDIKEKLHPIFNYMNAERKVWHYETVTHEREVIDPVTGEKKTETYTTKEWVLVVDEVEQLLTEADTMTDIYNYTYEQVTETDGDYRTQYYKLKDVKTYPGNRLYAYLQEQLRDNADKSMEEAVVLQAGLGYTLHQENAEWLADMYVQRKAYVSAASIPADLFPIIEDKAKEYGYPMWFIAGIIQLESSFDIFSENQSTGAYGLMQVMPSHWEDIAPELGYDPEQDKNNPAAQLDVGLTVLTNHFRARGINPSDVDWDTDAWKEQTTPAMTDFAGYESGNTQQRYRMEYGPKLWRYADQFKAAFAYAEGNLPWPVISDVKKVNSYFGWRNGVMHEGVDLYAQTGDRVVSVTKGEIVYAGWENSSDHSQGYGQFVVIKDANYEFVYGHLDKILVHEGDEVNIGDVIGLAGSTGHSSGPHLHFGVYIGDRKYNNYINPLLLITQSSR